MSIATKTNIIQTMQSILYDRSLQSEMFEMATRRSDRHGLYELSAWLLNGRHVLRFRLNGFSPCELVTEEEIGLPTRGLVDACLCMGENEMEHSFIDRGVTYMTNVQTEQLCDNIFADTMDELLDFGRESRALIHEWTDQAGRCMSMCDVQTYAREVHAQCYHMIASGGVVIRTQTIFEHD